jgi:hypothetical protein
VPYDDYLDDLVQRFWTYTSSRFAGRMDHFEESLPRARRPPVFTRSHAGCNLLIDGSLNSEQRQAIRTAIPATARHRWFRSMRSSQALVQSIFGHLRATNSLDVLADLRCDRGLQPFRLCQTDGTNLFLEREVTYMGEPRPTSMDVFIDAAPRIALECKLSERDVGRCSRPRRPITDPQYCNGNYQLQLGRTAPCALSEIGVRYWDYVPRLFCWSIEPLPVACPLNRTYQLVRNVLAASVDPSGNIVDGVAVLIFDCRNPEWQSGGAGFTAFQQVRESLVEPGRLQPVSWQDILAAMRASQRPSLGWLNNEVQLKYGL